MGGKLQQTRLPPPALSPPFDRWHGGGAAQGGEENVRACRVWAQFLAADTVTSGLLPPLPRRGNEAHERDLSGPHATRATAREDPCSGGHSTGVRGAAVSGIPESQACARRRLWAQPQMPRARLALHIHTPYVHTHVHTHRHTIRARTHAIRAHAPYAHIIRVSAHTHTSCAHILHTRLRLQRQIHVCTLNVCTCLCERAHASTYKDLILYNGMISFYNFLKSGPDCSPGQHRKRGARFLGQTKAERRSPDLGWKRLPPLEF